MMKDKNVITVPGGEESRNRSETQGLRCHLGILESQFPHLGKCFVKKVSEFGDGYEALCPDCSVWTSLPEGAALKVTCIIDCMVCGYGKRITEEDK
jgi:hypothetical protein